MKKGLIILAVVGVAFFAILVVCFTKTPPSTVQLTFLGYTKTGAGAEAVFSVQFPPRFGGCGWRDLQVSRKEQAIWKNWSSTNAAPPQMRWFNGPIKRSAAGVEPLAEAFAAFPVETTNEVSRIVIQVDENPPQEWPLERAMRILWASIRMSPSTPIGRSYFITNETTLKPAD